MQRCFKLAFVICLAFFVTAIALAPVQAEAAPSQATLTVKVDVDQADIFWNYTFLTKNTDLGKPSSIKLNWSLGDTPTKEKTETLIVTGKTSGKTTIVTDKGALVNINVGVYDNKNKKLGYISLQVKNNGQTESINITPPEFTEPNITWSNT